MMEFVARQTKKELFNAEFDILLGGVEKTGSIIMGSVPGSREGSFRIQFGGCQIQLSPARRKEALESAGKLIKRSPFRPYTVEQSNSRGIMFHDQIKTGFMQSAGYHLLSYDDAVYYLYFVGFGEKGICAPVCKGDTCVAEIRKDCVVVDDLHIFHIIVHEQCDTLAALILCCYMYIITYYRAGEKVLHGMQKKLVITKNKYLLSKCRTLL